MSSIRTPADIMKDTSANDDHGTKVVNDFNLVYDAFVARIMDKVTKQIRWNMRNMNRAVTEVVLMRYMEVDDYLEKDLKQTNIKPSTFFTGFYDTESGKFNYDTFVKAGIDTMVFEKAKKALGENGYVLLDVSDPSKSKKKLCTVTWAMNDETD